MSFYGNVFWELKNAFSKLIVKHKYNEDATTAMTVVGLDGQITLAPNNEWITLTADQDTVRCGITHKEIAAAGSIDTFNQAPANTPAAQVTTLSFKEPFQAAVVNYDKAGHVTGVTEKFVKLPISDTKAHIYHEAEEDDKTTLIIKGIDGEFSLVPNNEWIELTADVDNVECGITHVLPEDNGFEKPIVAVDPIEPVVNGTFAEGQSFNVPTVEYDEAGHITGVSYTKYALPVRDYDADLDTMQEDIKNLQIQGADHENRISEIEEKIEDYDSLQGIIDDLVDEIVPRLDALEYENEQQQEAVDWVEENKDALEDALEMAEWIGKKEDLLPANVEDLDNEITITNTMGCILDAVEALDLKLEAKPDEIGVILDEPTIAGCLIHLNRDAQTTNLQVYNNLAYMREVITKLCNILNSHDGINIDIEALLKPQGS